MATLGNLGFQITRLKRWFSQPAQNDWIEGYEARSAEIPENATATFAGEESFEDTLRLLLHAALIGGHIQGVSTWSDLEDLAMRRAKPIGTLLELTAASQDLPLMPKVNHARSQVVEDAAMHYDMVSRHLRRLGKLCGFAEVLKR
jgi:hypothetical protein